MPIAADIWIEPIRPNEELSLVAAFEISEQPHDDPARTGRSFQMKIEGLGDVAFDFVCCIKGQAIYSASLPDPAGDQDNPPEKAEILYRQLMRNFPA